jgi:Photosynthesis system II assembly factor YCF48/Putative zinc-finger
MPNDDREQQFERVLARQLRNASPDSACLDAEALAAFHERTLSPEEMARVKEHIAGCTRCEETLALVEQSEGVRAEEWEQPNVPVPVEAKVLPTDLHAGPRPKASRPIHPMAPRPLWRWILPVGALAASVIVWVGVREIQTQRSREMKGVQVAQNRQPAPPAPAAAYNATDQLREEKPQPEKLAEETRAQKAPASPSPKVASPAPVGAAATESAPPPPASASATRNKANFGISGAARVAAPVPAPPISSGAANRGAPPVPALPTAGITAPAGATGENRPAGVKKQAAVPSASETVPVTTAAPTADAASSSTSTAKSNATQIAIQARNVASLLQLAAGDPHYIVAPGEKQAWRVGEAGKIERSADGGKTWKLQKNGVSTDLTAGSATSDKVCWIVGKAGAVLLTTDGGKHWKQISSPISEDLGGVHATDAQHASIWDLSNRESFETTDAGATWSRTSKD